MKRFLSVLLTLFLAIAILAGCGIPPAADISADDHGAADETQGEDTPVLGPVDTVLSTWVEPDGLFYPYYYLLSETQRQAYALLYTGMLKGEMTISMGGMVEDDEILDVFTAVKNDHPEIFWVDCEFTHDNVMNDVWSLKPTYNSHAEDLDASRARFEAAAAPVISAAEDMTDVEKERYVHDWLTEHVVYDLTAVDAQNAYSALVDGRAVCAGYAMTFQYLMQELNVPCWSCEGLGLDEDAGSEDHVWNIVVLEGEPYNVDVTWGDYEDEDLSFTYYGYYNVADDGFSEEHIREGLSALLPPCTATDLSYEGLYDMTVQQAAYETVMEELAISGDNFISTKEEFIDRVRGDMTSRGEGEITLDFLVSDIAACEEIDRALNAGELEEPIFYAAAEALGLDNYRYEYSWQTISYDFDHCSIVLLSVTASIRSA